VRREEERRKVACTGFLVWKPEGKRPLGRKCHRYDDNINMNLHKLVCVGMGRIELAMKRDS